MNFLAGVRRIAMPWSIPTVIGKLFRRQRRQLSDQERCLHASRNGGHDGKLLVQRRYSQLAITATPDICNLLMTATVGRLPAQVLIKNGKKLHRCAT